MSSWLERELAQQLAPVRAPEQLWQRVISPRAPRRAARTANPIWMGAAAALGMAAMALVFAMPPSLSRLAAEELGRPADFQSADPQAIAQWLRAHAAVEVSFPPHTAARLTGARAIERRGARIGEVLYRVAGHNAALLVARAGTWSAPARHGESTWMDRGQVYALAFAAPAQSQLACQLCHSD